MSRDLTIRDKAVSLTGEYKQVLKAGEWPHYEEILYVAVSQENKVSCSLDSDVLAEDTKFAILIHKRKELPDTILYSRFKVFTINQDLRVNENKLDDKYVLKIHGEGFYSPARISLSISESNDGPIYICNWPDESKLQVIWDVYQKCLDCETAAEAQLLGKLAMANQKIVKLNKIVANGNYKQQVLTAERDQYKSLLTKSKRW